MGNHDPQTGAERYLHGRLSDPDYRAAHTAARNRAAVDDLFARLPARGGTMTHDDVDAWLADAERTLRAAYVVPGGFEPPSLG